MGQYDRLTNKPVPASGKILPALGAIKLTALARDDVAALHHEMRGTPYQANRTLGVISKMMNQAEAWGLRPDRSNPCYHVRKYKEHIRHRGRAHSFTLAYAAVPRSPAPDSSAAIHAP